MNYEHKHLGGKCNNRNQLKIIQNILDNSNDAENDELAVIMKSSKIFDLYDKFNEAKVSAAIIWELDDEELDEDIKLTRIEKKRYRAAQKQHVS